MMYENIRQSLDIQGYYTGQVNEFHPNMPEYFKLAHTVCTERYETEKRSNYIKWMNCLGGPNGSQYPIEMRLDKVAERKQFILDNNYKVDQQWQFFVGAEIKIFSEIIENLVFHLYTDLNKSNVKHNAKFTLYEDDDFTDLHIDDYTTGRKCAVLLYLSKEEDYIDGGGKLLLTSKRTKRLNIAETVLPVAPNFAIIDTEKHQLYHGVEPVKNGFRRFAFLDFIFVQS